MFVFSPPETPSLRRAFFCPDRNQRFPNSRFSVGQIHCEVLARGKSNLPT
jgi:hypothetical protein